LKILNLNLKGKVIILGIGNTIRGDDGAGSILAKRIKGKVPFTVFDAGLSPENYLEKIVKVRPNTILIIDAVDFGGRPGEVRLFHYHQIREERFFSTHDISLELLINFLLKGGVKSIIILAIQPKETKFKNRLSKEVSLVLKNLKKEFLILSK